MGYKIHFFAGICGIRSTFRRPMWYKNHFSQPFQQFYERTSRYAEIPKCPIQIEIADTDTVHHYHPHPEEPSLVSQYLEGTASARSSNHPF